MQDRHKVEAYIINDKKVRVAIYIRVSVIHQIDKDSLPMQQKRDRLKAFIFKQSLFLHL